MKKRYIIIGIIIGIIIIGGIIAMIINNSKKENINQDEDKYSKGTHHAQITIKDYGTINVELYADIAPITVLASCTGTDRASAFSDRKISRVEHLFA